MADTKRSTSLSDKVRQLRRTFLERLPDTLLDLRRQCERLKLGALDEQALADLYRGFHSIKGTAASFGLREISAEGGIGEGLVSQMRDGAMPDISEFLSLIVNLEAWSKQAMEQEAVKTEANNPPSFKMPTAPARENNKTIYLCEDDDLFGMQLSEQLSCFGYSVTIFTVPETLRAAVAAATPDAIIMDIVLGGPQSGIDVINALHDAGTIQVPPVLFISSRRDFQTRLMAVQAGGQAYFPKPFKPTELVEALDNLTLAHRAEPFRIMVVDDEPEIAAYHAFILEQVGMIVRALEDPERVLEELFEFKPDLILMDMYMPHCNGHDLSKVIRQVPDFISLPIVFLSSETDKVKQVSALRTGADGFLTKPIEPSDLISAVAIRAERMKTLRALMVKDSLTGLFNHTFTTQFLESSMAAAFREKSRLCFAMLDVDYFKQVNDSFGHPMGDQVLVALARLLQQRLRTSDLVGRYGGEEFALILRDVDLSTALNLVDELRQDFAKIRFQVGGGEFSCTLSGGVSAFPGYSASEDLIDAADKALYAAKDGGRDQVVAAPGEVTP